MPVLKKSQDISILEWVSKRKTPKRKRSKPKVTKPPQSNNIHVKIRLSNISATQERHGKRWQYDR